jgi:hypothetical protein
MLTRRSRAGVDATFDTAGPSFNFVSVFSSWFLTDSPLFKPTTPAPFIERLCMLLLEVICDPRGTSDLALAGAWIMLAWTLSGKVHVAMPLIKAGLLDAMCQTLQQSSPTDWVSWKTPAGIMAGNIMHLGWTLSTLEMPVSKAQLILDKGLIDCVVSIIKVRGWFVR